MKKVMLLVAAVAISGSMFAQNGTPAKEVKMTESKKETKTTETKKTETKKVPATKAKKEDKKAEAPKN